MFDQHTQDYLETIAFFQRLPALEAHGIGGDAETPMPTAAAELIRDWRRMRYQHPPEPIRAALAECDDNMLFNVLSHCLDILLLRIVPKYDLRRQRRHEQKERRRARQAAEAAESSSTTRDADTAPTQTVPAPTG